MDEYRFDELLEGPPPDDVARDVTPWRRAMNRLLTGMALNSITLNLWGLNYILPYVGMLLMVLGLRGLRNENRWLRWCWYLILPRCGWMIAMLCLNTTILHRELYAAPGLIALSVLIQGCSLFQYFLLWEGLRTIQEKAGLVPRAGAALALLFWNLTLYGLTEAENISAWVSLVIVAAYCFILRSLVKLSRELDESGYCISPAPVGVSDRAVSIGLTALLLLGCVCGYRFFGQYPMNWQPAEPIANAQALDTKEQLRSIGFPAEVLEDLTEEDILACKGATHVVVEQRYLPSDMDQTDDILFTSISVALPGEERVRKIFFHFRWLTEPDFIGTEAIRIRPAAESLNDNWVLAGDESGRLLYTIEEKDYTSDYFFLGLRSSDDPLYRFRTEPMQELWADFSLPEQGTDRRGYISYTLKQMKEDSYFSSMLFYTHQTGWFQYPVVTAEEMRLGLVHSEEGVFFNAFLTFQYQLQEDQPPE